MFHGLSRFTFFCSLFFSFLCASSLSITHFRSLLPRQPILITVGRYFFRATTCLRMDMFSVWNVFGKCKAL